MEAAAGDGQRNRRRAAAPRLRDEVRRTDTGSHPGQHAAACVGKHAQQAAAAAAAAARGDKDDTLTHLEEPLSLGGRQASDCTQRGDGFWVHRGRQAAVAGAHGSL